MTDNEIIKALEYCRRTDRYVICNSDCPMYEYCESDEEGEMNICGLALNIINRQKTEIEELTELAGKRFDGFASEYDSKMKSEAIKEFAERLDRKFAFYYPDTQCISVLAVRKSIQNELTEMMESKK